MILGACDLDAQGLETEDVGLESTEQAVYSGWTPYTSDEYPPISCDGVSLMSSMQCTGRYCDNIRAYCAPSSGVRGGSYWTTYFSEEATNWRTCNPGAWVTGLSCTGDYCDNVSLQCTYISNITARGCYWTGSVSEEGGGYLNFGSGYYARGAMCNGSYCDNMRFYVCQR
jgi:hypothetical protein